MLYLSVPHPKKCFYVEKVFVHDSGDSANGRISGADCANKANSEKTACGWCHETALIGMTLA